MSKKLFIGILAVTAILAMNCICSSACGPMLGETDVPTAAPSLTHTPMSTPTRTLTLTPAPTSTSTQTGCEETLAGILQTAGKLDPEGNTDQVHTLVTYAVHGDLLSGPAFSDVPEKYLPYQQDLAGQKEIWSLFTRIIPADQRTQVHYFIVFTDSQYGTRAEVRQVYDPHFWALEVDIADAVLFPSSAATLIHEFGHLLTLNDSQVVPDQAVFDNPKDYRIVSQEMNKCPGYFVASGCSNSYSYINLFVHQFWSDLLPEWDAIRAGSEKGALTANLHVFYTRYADQFVSEYAAYSPEEDIAESWSRFILAPRPEGNSIADKKVSFFYKNPELVTLRTTIISNLCAYAGTP